VVEQALETAALMLGTDKSRARAGWIGLNSLPFLQSKRRLCRYEED
jgi:hypothetical protein